ncbi:MAG: ThiS family protein [Methanothrix sp.]|nr:MAG: ThiS family protein [Methanothrix sp.]
MLIRLKPFGRFRAPLGEEMDVDLPVGSSVSDLLLRLSSLSSDLHAQIFDAGGEVREDVNVMVNGRHFLSLGGTSTPLEEGDEVALFPAVVGG